MSAQFEIRTVGNRNCNPERGPGGIASMKGFFLASARRQKEEGRVKMAELRKGTLRLP
jgi:hypothetical protein